MRVLTTILFAIISAQLFAQEALSFSDYFKPVWERTKSYTLSVANAMPEEYYAYKPTDDVKTFGEQMYHIVGNLYGLTSKFVSHKESPMERKEVANLSKAEIIQSMEDAFDFVSNTLTSMKPSEFDEMTKLFTGDLFPKSHIFILMKDHTANHRGQAIVYLRLKNIQPPKYVGW